LETLALAILIYFADRGNQIEAFLTFYRVGLDPFSFDRGYSNT